MPMLLEVKPDQPEEMINTQQNQVVTPMGEQKDEDEIGVTKENKISLRDYCRQIPVVDVHTTCGEAASLLNQDQDYPCIVLCDDHMRPLGLLMRETLYRMLNGRFAADLFYRKPVVHAADSSPVIVDVHAEATAIIDIALARSEQYFYDCLIVTEEDRLLGVLTMRDVMSLSRKLQHAASEERVHIITQSRQEITRINDSVTKLVRAARNAGEEASQIMQLSEQGASSLSQVDASYNRVYQHMEGQQKHADDMLSSIDMGSGMARSIRSLADQSGLLAMNASIEAAHAGEYGRGFQVVAGEIRALAKQTREVAGNMSSLLDDIGGLTRQTVELVRASAAEINNSSVHVNEGGTAFKQLNTAVAGMSHIAEVIAVEGKTAGELAEHIRERLEDMVQADD
ncbi:MULTISPECIES: methyl-accepting chemotaxis protein [Paenibacillus]|uniref:Methyl-accepting chemotaxis protein n=1 Tax=Paenibacillus pabuli TaxID=1472 RepID=A0A855XVZ8_9BACL|nr:MULTISPECIES: methyl-accepting chemotaxis protein [Paenibacillus]PWW41088.1 methyl-accepting chemotaxis protein [Paenibacillus pabuli]PXW12212.1 methyl-accepting chemotaxis protein [Paenibacillus taichungensis]